MPPDRQALITLVGYVCRVMQDDLYAKLTRIHELWAGIANYQALLTQGEIDSVTRLHDAGLSLQQVTDAIYMLSLILERMNAQLPATSVMAQFG